MTGQPIAAIGTKDSHSKQPYKVLWPVRNALLAFFLMLTITCDLFFKTKRVLEKKRKKKKKNEIVIMSKFNQRNKDNKFQRRIKKVYHVNNMTLEEPYIELNNVERFWDFSLSNL